MVVKVSYRPFSTSWKLQKGGGKRDTALYLASEVVKFNRTAAFVHVVSRVATCILLVLYPDPSYFRSAGVYYITSTRKGRVWKLLHGFRVQAECNRTCM